MDAFLLLRDTFRSIADKFDYVAQVIDGWWIGGDQLAAPFYYFGDKFDYCADQCAAASDWLEWLQGLYDALPTWDDLIAALAGQYGTLVKTAEELVAWLHNAIDLDFDISGLWTWINNAPEWLAEQFITMKDTVVDWVVEQFESILDRVFEE